MAGTVRPGGDGFATGPPTEPTAAGTRCPLILCIPGKKPPSTRPVRPSTTVTMVRNVVPGPGWQPPTGGSGPAIFSAGMMQTGPPSRH